MDSEVGEVRGHPLWTESPLTCALADLWGGGGGCGAVKSLVSHR